MKRVPFSSIIEIEEHEDTEASWINDPDFWAQQLEQNGIQDISPQQVASHARNFRDLESLVRALDSLETIGSLAELSEEYVSKQHLKIP